MFTMSSLRSSTGLPEKVTSLHDAPRTAGPSAQSPPDRQYWSDQMLRVAATEDQESFLRIYDHFAPRLHRYVLGLGAQQAKAEDLVQEAMLRAWRSAPRFDPARACLATWLFRITRNLFIDSVRRMPMVAYGEGIPDELGEGLGVEVDTVEDSAPESYTDQVGLGRAIDALAATQARLVRMSFLEAKSHSEIASELGMPLGSVKSTLRRAFARLQRGLAGADA